MKKTLISAALVLSVLGVAGAQEQGTTTPPALPPVIATGSTTIDAQIKTLRKEYDAKIRALQMEYLAKLKVIVGDRVASSTRRAMMIPFDDGKRVGGATGTMMRAGDDRKGMMGSSSELRKGDRPQMPGGGDFREGGRPEVEGASSSTVGDQVPNGKAWGFFKRFLGF